jgi:hypothetical protein
MGIFDFFKNKKIDAKNTEKELAIRITSTEQGSHGDHFGGLLGFPLLHSEKGAELVYKLIQFAEEHPPTIQEGLMNLRDAVLNEFDKITKKIQVRIIHTGNNIPSAFPYLKTDLQLPFKTEEIIEWSHMDGLEAEVCGQGRDAFSVGFFATDYAVNHRKYKEQSEWNIKLSAICLSLEKPNLDSTEDAGELRFSKDFAMYMPNTGLPGKSYYDFIGTLISVEEIIVLNEPHIVGFMTKIKLIHGKTTDFFTIDMFVNKSNIQIDSLQEGMSVSGCLWLQGEISS